MNLEKGYEFDDVLLVPRPSRIESRRTVDISTTIEFPPEFLGRDRGIEVYETLKLDVPIIASPMKGIVGTKLIIELGKLGGIGILHRFHSTEKGIPDVIAREVDMYTLENSGVPYGFSVGVGKPYERHFLNQLYSGKYPNAKILLVDTANGYSVETLTFISRVRDTLKKEKIKCLVMGGNVVDGEGIRVLSNAGAMFWRVGIGSGALCTTRNKTGVGMPQVTALNKVKQYCTKYRKDGYIVSDGGIRTSGDIVKALAVGADFVMVGSLLATTLESTNNGEIYGMASKELQENFYGAVKSVEGISKKVEKTTTLEELIHDISWSIKSACGYLDAKNLTELRKNARLIETGQGSIVEKE